MASALSPSDLRVDVTIARHTGASGEPSKWPTNPPSIRCPNARSAPPTSSAPEIIHSSPAYRSAIDRSVSSNSRNACLLSDSDASLIPRPPAPAERAGPAPFGGLGPGRAEATPHSSLVLLLLRSGPDRPRSAASDQDGRKPRL